MIENNETTESRLREAELFNNLHISCKWEQKYEKITVFFVDGTEATCQEVPRLSDSRINGEGKEVESVELGAWYVVDKGTGERVPNHQGYYEKQSIKPPVLTD